MKDQLTREQSELHQSALRLCRERSTIEFKLVEVLQKIDRSKLYLKFGTTSLFQYSVRILGLSDATAYNFMAVSRKADQIVELQIALRDQKLTVCKAAKVVAAISRSNARQLIDFAVTHSTRQIEAEVARRNPKFIRKDSARPVTGNQIEVRLTLNEEEYNWLLRARELLAQKTAQNPEFGRTVGVALKEYVERHDPVLKAQRALTKPVHRRAAPQHKDEKVVSKVQLFTGRVAEQPHHLQSGAEARPAQKITRREPLTADQRHKVNQRDGGRCTFVDAAGHRCTNERWLEIHHIKPVSQGGTNDPENLTTLCYVHHDLTHQLTLPIEGQVTWLREPVRAYRADYAIGKSPRNTMVHLGSEQWRL